MDFLEGLEPLLKAFWYVAIPTSVIFLIQTVMTFVGADYSDGLEADFEGDLSGGDAPFQLFSLRNLINFLLGFGWTGISFYDVIQNKILLVVLALIVGLLFVYVFFVIIKQVTKLAEDNSFRIENTLNKTAEVYLTVPAEKSGKGRVLISVKGAVHELNAVTEGGAIPTGAIVRVVKLESDNLLIVDKI